jgi:hypothetical protein
VKSCIDDWPKCVGGPLFPHYGSHLFSDDSCGLIYNAPRMRRARNNIFLCSNRVFRMSCTNCVVHTSQRRFLASQRQAVEAERFTAWLHVPKLCRRFCQEPPDLPSHFHVTRLFGPAHLYSSVYVPCFCRAHGNILLPHTSPTECNHFWGKVKKRYGCHCAEILKTPCYRGIWWSGGRAQPFLNSALDEG